MKKIILLSLVLVILLLISGCIEEIKSLEIEKAGEESTLDEVPAEESTGEFSEIEKPIEKEKHQEVIITPISNKDKETVDKETNFSYSLSFLEEELKTCCEFLVNENRMVIHHIFAKTDSTTKLNYTVIKVNSKIDIFARGREEDKVYDPETGRLQDTGKDYVEINFTLEKGTHTITLHPWIGVTHSRTIQLGDDGNLVIPPYNETVPAEDFNYTHCIENPEEGEYAHGEILVNFIQDVTKEQVDELLSSYNLSSSEIRFPGRKDYRVDFSGDGLGFWRYLSKKGFTSRKGRVYFLLSSNTSMTCREAYEIFYSYPSVGVEKVFCIYSTGGVVKVPGGEENEWVCELQKSNIVRGAHLNLIMYVAT